MRKGEKRMERIGEEGTDKVNKFAEEIEKDKRKKIVITGLNKETMWNMKKIDDWMKEKLKVDVGIAEVWQVGKEKN